MYAALSVLPVIFLSCIPKLKNKYKVHQHSGAAIVRHVFDFLFVLGAGVIYLVLQYVFVDGVNALLPAFLLILSILTTKGIVESIFAKIMNRKNKL
jgi:hypothetical protein